MVSTMESPVNSMAKPSSLEELAILETTGRRVIVGRERPGSWHELLAHRKVVDDAAHDKAFPGDDHWGNDVHNNFMRSRKT